MERIIAFTYGTLCYLMFLATALYAVAFLGNIGLTRTINGEATVLPCCPRIPFLRLAS
jgi:hypothetical protein